MYIKFHLPYLRRLRRYTLAEPWSRSRAAGLAGMWIQESSPFSSSLDSLDTLFCRQSFPINSTQTHSLWMFCKSFGVAVFATLITGAQIIKFLTSLMAPIGTNCTVNPSKPNRQTLSGEG